MRRRLRSDFGAPDAVMLVYTESWPELLEDVVVALAGSATVFAAREDSASLAAARGWHDRLAPGVRANVTLLDVETSSPWLRDFGPIQVVDAEGLTWLDADYGSERPADDAFPDQVSPLFGAPLERVFLDVDGGAFISDGRGLCVAVREYFELHGPDLDDRPAMDEMQRKLGCPTLVLVSGPDGEGARHADMIGQFVGPDTLVWATSTDPEDRRRLDAGLETIRRAAHRHGREIRAVRVPSFYGPADRYWSYANLVQAGEVILVPQYGRVAGAADGAALQAIRGARRGLKVVPIEVGEAALLGGALHCLTLGIEW